jgi:hypothetical protein
LALRDKLRDRIQPYLEPGEEVHQVFLAQTGPSPYFALLSYWILLIAGGYRIVVVTDRAIIVLKAGKWRPAKPKSLLRRGPRQVRLGPVSGLWAKVLLGESCWVHKRFHKDIEAADADLDAGYTVQPPAPPSPSYSPPGPETPAVPPAP